MADDRIEAKRLAYLALAQWASTSSLNHRNAVILQAAEAGIPKGEIAVIVGMSRGHVYQVLKDERARRAAS